MEKLNTKIEEFEHKVTKDGKPYGRIKVREGFWMSAFNSKLSKMAEENVGKNVELEFSNDNDFRNLKALRPLEEKVNVEQPKAKANINAMYVSYAKDIFSELIKLEDRKEDSYEVMKEAVNLVKVAIYSFENIDDKENEQRQGDN